MVLVFRSAAIAAGASPTGTVATTVFVLPPITDTVSSKKFAT